MNHVMHFPVRKVKYFDSNCTEVFSRESNWQQVRNGLCNGSMPSGNKPLSAPMPIKGSDSIYAVTRS